MDWIVFSMLKNNEINNDEITREQKAKLLSIASVDICIDGKKSPLMVGLPRTSNSLVECFDNVRLKFIYP